MTVITRFFELMNQDELPNIPVITPQGEAETALTEFMQEKTEFITGEYLDKLNKVLEHPTNTDCLDVPKLHEEYMNHKKAIEKLIALCKTKPTLTQHIEKIIQNIFKQNRSLVHSSLQYSHQALNQAGQTATKLLQTAKPSQIDKWSKVTDALFERIDKNRRGTKLSLELLNKDQNEVEKRLKELMQYKPTDKGPSHKNQKY